ncbi:MAG: hypothetical protein RI907_2886 [Pseudomonadota bacterium]|jgi:hypothetical protein
MRTRHHLAGVATLAASLWLAGCHSGPPPLYDWGPYQAGLYEQFKGTGNGPEARIGPLEDHLRATQGSGRQVPPGYLAHLGYLHLLAGHNDQAARYWDMEKQAFPESRVFMDFLLKNLHRQEKQP